MVALFLHKRLLILTFIRSVIIFITAFAFLEAAAGGMPDDISKRSGMLMKRLDLNRPGLERVRALSSDSAAAVKELLSYYRNRTTVKHPVDRMQKEAAKGKAAGSSDMRNADNALKHVFVGQSAYPPYFCGDDINWGMRPVPDNEWVWQLNRMYFWQSLALAYWHTGDEKYAQEWCFQLVDWTRKNPRDKAHDYAWRSIEAGIRGYSWTNLYQRFLDSPYFTPEVLTAFLNSFYDHASFLMTRYSKGSNWALMEAEGMAFIAIMFPEFIDSGKWKSEAVARLNTEINRQVYPDGHQRELAMGYHIGSIGWFSRTFNFASMNGMTDLFPESYTERIIKMCEVPMKLGLPDGSSTQFGDSWKGQPGNLWGNLKEWGDIYGREDFKYVSSEGKEGREPDSTLFALPYSGFYSMRSGWNKDAICLVLKCGPDGGGHCQPDNGTFELYAGGRGLMPDAGSYIYSGDPQNRAWFRQTSVHQTLTLNSANTAYSPALLEWKPGNEVDLLVVENAGYKDLTHRRALFFIEKRYFVIVDEAYGKGVGNVDIHFQFMPSEALFNMDDLSVRTGFSEGWNVLVKTMKQDNILLEKEEGQVSYQYTKKETRPAFRFRLPKTSPDEVVRFITVVAPFSGTEPKITAEFETRANVISDQLMIRIREKGKVRRTGYILGQ